MASRTPDQIVQWWVRTLRVEIPNAAQQRLRNAIEDAVRDAARPPLGVSLGGWPVGPDPEPIAEEPPLPAYTGIRESDD